MLIVLSFIIHHHLHPHFDSFIYIYMRRINAAKRKNELLVG